MKNLFPNTGTYRGRYSGSKKRKSAGVPCDGCSHCDSKCCTIEDCVCVDCPPAGISKKRGQLKIIDPTAKLMNELFKTPGTYRGDRYSDILMLGKSCGDKCNRLYLPPRLSKRKREGYQNCMSTCEAEGGTLDVLLSGGGGGGGTGGDGTGGGGTGGGGNGGDGNGGGGNGGGTDTTTIMIWAGVALLLLALIIGGAIAIKKIRA